MTIEQRIALLNAALMRVNVRAIAMQAENLSRVHRGEAIAYGEHAFEALIEEEGLDSESVARVVTGSRPQTCCCGRGLTGDPE